MNMEELEMEKLEIAKEVGLGLDKVANVLDAHRKNVGDIEMDMQEAELNHCGSPMCFAGLFAVLSKSKEELEDADYDYNDGEGLDYNYGRGLIAKECGLDGSHATSYWAMDNPKIWGNEYGASIFTDKSAYGVKNEDDTLTLDILIAHLRGVAKRCAELETT